MPDASSTPDQVPSRSLPIAAVANIDRPLLEPAPPLGRCSSQASLEPPTSVNHLPLNIPSDASVAGSINSALHSSSSRDDSSTTNVAPIFSVGGSRASSNISLARYQSHENMSAPGMARGLPSSTGENPFAIAPEALVEIISSRSIVELEALGGLAELACGLQTDLAAGLGMDETWPHDTVISSSWVAQRDEGDFLQARETAYGTNRIPDRKIRGIIELMVLALNDKVLILLSVVAVISLLLGLYQAFGQPHAPGQPRVEWVDGVTIMTAVVIVVVAGALNDYQKERQFAQLNKKVRGLQPPGNELSEVLTFC